MMKHTGSLALGLGLFLGLPAFTFGGGLPDSVSSALDDTVKALEVLGQLKDDLEAGNPVAQGLVESMTEAPSGTSQGRDQLLTKLRDEVSGLQSQLDTRRLREGVAVPSTSGQNPDGVTTGLPRTFVRAMGPGGLPATEFGTPGSGGPADPGYPAGTKPERGPEPTETGAAPGGKDEAATPAPNAGQPSPSPEGKGYSANPLRQAKACFRAGRYQQGLDILEAVTPFTEGDYWRAKLLDRLGRTDEALLLFASVEVAEDAGPLAAAAKRDAEFAAWRAEFEKKTGGKDQ